MYVSDTSDINTTKGTRFDIPVVLPLSLVIPIPELPGAEVRNVKNAWLPGPTVSLLCPAGVDQEVELHGSAQELRGLHGSLLLGSHTSYSLFSVCKFTIFLCSCVCD